jgi:hypothetical protein
LITNDFWLFPELKSVLKDEDFRILKTSEKKKKKKKCDEGTENYSITGDPKIFPRVAASLG